MDLKFFNRAIAPLKRSVMSMVSRAVLKSVNDATDMQLLKIKALADEVKDKVERFQNYGFTSNPQSGAEALLVFPQGNRDHGVVIAVDDRRYRLKALQNGEVAMYTDEGDSIIMKRDRVIETTTLTYRVNCTTYEVNATSYNVTASGAANVTSPTVTLEAATAVNLNTPDVGASGNMGVEGNVTADGDVESTSVGTSLGEIKTTYNGHTHDETESVTSAPNETI